MSGADQNIAKDSPAEVIFTPKPDFQLVFDGIHAEQELGRPFLFHLDMSSGKYQSQISTLVGSACCTWLYQSDSNNNETNTYFHGIVARIISVGQAGGAYRYKFEIRPWIWLLSHITDCKIFQNKSAFQIVTQIFRDAGFSDFQDKRQSGAGDQQLEYCVQYRETSLAFVSRLMEQFGFYYYFQHSKDSHMLILADDPNAHTTLPDAIPFTFDANAVRTVDDHIWSWTADMALTSGKWTFQDYNFTTPSADLTAKTVKPADNQYGKFEVYEYPGIYDESGTGQRVSDIRMQELLAARQVHAGETNSRKLVCGSKFTMSEHPDQSNNRDYLITHSTTTVGGAEGTPNPDSDHVDTHRAEIKAIPGDTAFRLQRTTPRPVIRGPQTAKVVGSAGDEITTDQYGRIKVRFHWDRDDTVQDDQRTCWIRVAQTWGGGTWGTMFIPRIGQEVVVEFLEGNPDRPLVTGVVYNANNTVPYALPDNKTRSTIKSASSPGGNGSNELRFEDKAGQEEVYLHAQYDFNREVKHNETTTITNDHSVTVTTGNDSLTISSGNHSVTISAGKSSVTAAQSITLTVGGSSITIDPSGVSISSPTVSVQASASMTLDGGGSLSATAGMISLN